MILVLSIVITIATLSYVATNLYLLWRASDARRQIEEKKETPNQFYNVEAFKKLAGIIPHDKEKAAFNSTNIKLNEGIIDEISNTDYENDPLSSLPISRISKEAKSKIAEIVKEDIRINFDNTLKQ